VSLRGVTVPGGPWRPRVGFMAKGVHIATLPLGIGCGSGGLAVSLDDSLMVVSNTSSHQLSVYRTVDGGLVRSFGSHGIRPGKFFEPYGLCMTARDTLLVAEWGNCRVQEVTLEGAHVKFIPVDACPMTVAVHGDVVAVAVCGDDMDATRLYSYTTGALIREIEDSYVLNIIIGANFTPDGKHLAIGRASGPISLVSVDGGLVRRVDPNGSYRGMSFTCTEDLVLVGHMGFSVYSAADGGFLRSWGHAFGIKGRLNTSVSGNRLYVLDGVRVQVYA